MNRGREFHYASFSTANRFIANIISEEDATEFEGIEVSRLVICLTPRLAIRIPDAGRSTVYAQYVARRVV